MKSINRKVRKTGAKFAKEDLRTYTEFHREAQSSTEKQWPEL